MISSQLDLYIKAATAYAASLNGRTTSLVHIVLAVLDDPLLQGILRACGVSYLDLRQEAIEVLAEDIGSTASDKSDPEGGRGLSALSLYTLQTAQQKAFAKGLGYAGVLEFMESVLEIHDNGSIDFQARRILGAAGLTAGSFAKAKRDRETEPAFEFARLRAPNTVPTGYSDAAAINGSSSTPPANSRNVQYCTDLTALAKEGKLDRSHCREAVMEELVVVLARRKKRNAILIGEPGVGKTSVVEELACLINERRAGPKLNGATILSLDMGALVGGTKYRGELEERVTALVAAVSANPDIILFIDEIHVLGSSGHSASGASDILKPALASGVLRCIGATTLSEYKRYFEADGAMSRRFAPIHVAEPTREASLQILSAAVPVYEKFHGVAYPEWVVETALDLAIRYIPERRLPDKALELLDDIGGRAAMNGNGITRQLVSDCISSKTGRPVGRRNVAAALAGLDTEAREIATAIMRNDIAEDHAVIAVLGAIGCNVEGPVRSASAALGRSYEDVDMSEFGDETSASSLLGAPPGYVGHDSGGRLYDIAKRAPGGVLHLRNVNLASPVALRIVDECVKQGYVRDRTARVAGMAGIQLVVSMEESAGNAMGFASSVHSDEVTGVGIVDGADSMVRLRAAMSGVEADVASGLKSLVSSARALGIRMTFGDEVESHVVGLVKAGGGNAAKEFSRLVRSPILDYLVSETEDFVVEPSDNGIRISKHEAA